MSCGRRQAGRSPPGSPSAAGESQTSRSHGRRDDPVSLIPSFGERQSAHHARQDDERAERTEPAAETKKRSGRRRRTIVASHPTKAVAKTRRGHRQGRGSPQRPRKAKAPSSPTVVWAARRNQPRRRPLPGPAAPPGAPAVEKRQRAPAPTAKRATAKKVSSSCKPGREGCSPPRRSVAVKVPAAKGRGKAPAAKASAKKVPGREGPGQEGASREGPG